MPGTIASGGKDGAVGSPLDGGFDEVRVRNLLGSISGGGVDEIGFARPVGEARFPTSRMTASVSDEGPRGLTGIAGAAGATDFTLAGRIDDGGRCSPFITAIAREIAGPRRSTPSLP